MKKNKVIIAAAVDNLRRIFQIIHEYSKKAEYATGLTGPQLWAIKVIAENKSLCVSDLAARMYLHAATVIGILDRLEKRGLITRSRSREDRRFVVVELTGLGRELVRKSPEVAQGLIVRGLERLPQQTIENIAEGLSRLVELLDAARVPPRLLLSNEVNQPAGKASGRAGALKGEGL